MLTAVGVAGAPIVASARSNSRAGSAVPMTLPDRSVLVRIALVWVAVWAAVTFSGLLSDRASLVSSNLLQALVPAAAATGCWWAVKRSPTRVDGRAWTFLGASAAAWSAGQLVWTAYDVVGVGSPFPSVADIGYIAAIPLALIGVWSITPKVAASTRLVAVVDGLIIAGSLVAISWPLVLAPGWDTGEGGRLLVALSLVYPAGSLVIVSSILMVLVRSQRGGTMPIVALAGAMSLLGLADSYFVWQASQGIEADLSLADGAWVGGHLLLLVASLRYPRGVEGVRLTPGMERSFRRSAVPLTLACIAMVVRVVLASTGHVGDAFLDVVIVVVAALILVRHLMEMWENRSLTQALEVKVGELTAREAELSHQALHDPLTGLANRRLFGDRVDHALERSRRTGERTAVLFIDLDDFKTVNDSLGHPAGDQLLVGVATRISACVRPGDTVARLGGDEFGIVMEGLASPDEAAVVAARVLDALEIAFPLDGRQVFTKASIGVAHADSAPGARGEQVLADADAALYEAKANGKATFRQFEEEMRESVVARLEIIQDLRGVSAPGQFVCHYQPIVELSTGRTVAVEALVRWDHPARGLLGPSSFIALAEETGVIVELGLEVVRQATTQVAQWWARGDLPEDLELHVNLSGRQLEQSDLAAQICAVVDTAGFPRDQLVLEITESIAVDIDPRHLERLVELRETGIRLAIDDFGTGYSSLSYLRTLPVDVLKVDRTFAGTTAGATDLVLMEAIVRLGDSLGIDVIAEGIEHGEQVESLVGLGCDRAQGYLFARPVPAADLPEVARTTSQSRSVH
jgi:diguanylate cyclase (GGDEF)-like protein